MSVRVIVGDALTVLRTLESESVQVVCTSPPYFQLRDYQCDGQIGMESTPAEFIANLMAVFDEVRRVLRPDGTCWVNLGDSMSGSGKGPTGKNGLGNHEVRQGFVGTRAGSGGRPYDTSDKAPRDYQDGGSSSSDLCGGCRAALLGRTSHSDSQPALGSADDAAAPIQGHILSDSLSPDSLGSGHQPQTGQSCLATPDRPQTPDLEAEQPRASQASTTDESARPLPAGCSHCANCDACLAVVRSSQRARHLCARRQAYTLGTSQPDDSSADRMSGKGLSSTASGRPPYVHKEYTMPPAKNLLLMPYRFAISMQDRGWIVRSQICWAKTSAMPESVRDRPTSAWEPIWMFAKSRTYYYDAEAVRQPHAPTTVGRRWVDGKAGGVTTDADELMRGNTWRNTTTVKPRAIDERGANLRNFWLLGPAPSKLEHWASFPPEIPRRCILAGTSAKGACPACGAPWVRITERGVSRYSEVMEGRSWREVDESAFQRGIVPHRGEGGHTRLPGGQSAGDLTPKGGKTLGWQQGCGCPPAESVPCVVLDPFAGSFTTCLVAERLGRDSIGIELNEQYVAIGKRRIESDAPMLTEHAVTVTPAMTQADLFKEVS